jgi:hypothetical protein
MFEATLPRARGTPLHRAREGGQPARIGSERELRRAGELLDGVLDPERRPHLAAAPRGE